MRRLKGEIFFVHRLLLDEKRKIDPYCRKGLCGSGGEIISEGAQERGALAHSRGYPNLSPGIPRKILSSSSWPKSK